MQFRGAGLVGLGAVVLVVSPILSWIETVGRPASAIAALIFAMGVASLLLLIVARRTGQAWPFIYSRVAGAVALVALIYEIARRGPPAPGALVVGIAAVLVVTASAGALAPQAAIERREWVRNR